MTSLCVRSVAYFDAILNSAITSYHYGTHSSSLQDAIRTPVSPLLLSLASPTAWHSAFASDFCISIFSVGLTGSHLAVLYLLYPPVRQTHAFEGHTDNMYRRKSLAVAPGPPQHAAEQPKADMPQSVFISAKEPSNHSVAAGAEDADTKEPLVPQASEPPASIVPSQAVLHLGEEGQIHSRVGGS